MFFRLRIHHPTREGIPDDMPPWLYASYPVADVKSISTPYESGGPEMCFIDFKSEPNRRLLVGASLSQLEAYITWFATFQERGAAPRHAIEARWVERGSEWKQ